MADGRGRLSSLDLVPDEGRDEIHWAFVELNKRERSQADILFELNDRLAVHGIDPISKSAFNRAAVRASIAARNVAEMRQVFAGIADQFSAKDIDDSNVVIGEMIKNMLMAVIQSVDGVIDAKGAMELAKGFHHVAAGQKLSAEQRAKRAAEFETKAEAAIETVVKATGLTAEQAAQLRRDLLGVRTPGASGG